MANRKRPRGLMRIACDKMASLVLMAKCNGTILQGNTLFAVQDRLDLFSSLGGHSTINMAARLKGSELSMLPNHHYRSPIIRSPHNSTWTLDPSSIHLCAKRVKLVLSLSICRSISNPATDQLSKVTTHLPFKMPPTNLFSHYATNDTNDRCARDR